MGAIVAIIGENGDPELPVRLQRMLRRSLYRGSADYSVEHGFALGIQTRDGDASMATKGNWRVAFHGFVGNWAALASNHGWHFPEEASHADRVTVAYEALGNALFSKLRGEFSMLIVNRRRRTLLAVRDVIGRRPLYHSTAGRRKFIATEVRQIIAGSGVTPEIDIEGLVQEMLIEHEDPCRTLVRQVVRLLPNTAVEFGPPPELEVSESELCWRPPPERTGRYDADELVTELEVLLERALDRCLENVPFAVSLSGGVDSTVLWGLVARRIRQGDPVALKGQAYSHVFPGLACDETERILTTHRFAGTSGVLMDLRADDLRADIARLATEVDGFHLGGLPFAERHARWLSRDSRRIDLVGEGADEWLGGTTSYLADFLLSGNLIGLVRDLFRFQLGPGQGRSQFVHHRIVQPVLRRLRPGLPSTVSSEWLHPDRHRPHLDFDRRIAALDGRRYRSRSRRSLLRRLILVQNWHELESIEQVMARFGVERRCPFMDVDIIEFSLSIPGRALTDGLRPKHLLRRVGEGLAPPAVLDRLDKTGYNAAFESTARRIVADFPGSLWNLLDQEVVTSQWMEQIKQAVDCGDSGLLDVIVMSVADVNIRKLTCAP